MRIVPAPAEPDTLICWPDSSNCNQAIAAPASMSRTMLEPSGPKRSLRGSVEHASRVTCVGECVAPEPGLAAIRTAAAIDRNMVRGAGRQARMRRSGNVTPRIVLVPALRHGLRYSGLAIV